MGLIVGSGLHPIMGKAGMLALYTNGYREILSIDTESQLDAFLRHPPSTELLILGDWLPTDPKHTIRRFREQAGFVGSIIGFSLDHPSRIYLATSGCTRTIWPVTTAGFVESVRSALQHQPPPIPKDAHHPAA